jgi:acyl-CoA dehydrogenase
MTELADTLAEALEEMAIRRANQAGQHATAAWDDSLWDVVRSQGFTALDDEEVGLDEFIAVARSVGRHAIGMPIVETGLATWLARATGIRLDHDELTLVSFDTELTARPSSDGGMIVTGTMSRVPWGRRSGAVLASARTPGGIIVALLRGFTVQTEGSNLAGEPRDDLRASDVHVRASDLALLAGHELPELMTRAALMRAAQAAGAMQSALALALDYSRTRVQFSKPIGSFQAVQHLLVNVAEAHAMTEAAVEAVMRDEVGYRQMSAAIAKLISAEQTDEFTRAVHQVFGAIGATEEHPLHLFTRRLWSWQDECGSPSYWSRFVGRALLADTGNGFWEALTSVGSATADEVRDGALAW